MDINEIMKILPHRYPMLLVDRILEIIPGEKIVAIKNVSANENFFVGHYPSMPIMPGVLIIEALAQTGACAILSMEGFEGKTPILAAVDKAKFRSKVVPGDTLCLETEIIKIKKNAGIGKGKAYVEDKIVAEAEITFMIV